MEQPRTLNNREKYLRHYRHEHADKVSQWNRQYYEKKKEDILSRRRALRRVCSAFRSLRSIDTALFV